MTPWAAKEALDALQSNKLTRLDELGEQIRTHHSHAARAAGEAVENARLAGECLAAAKGMLDHGKWLPWLKEHCQISPRTAQLYLKLAKQLPEDWASNAQRAAHLTSLRRAQAMLASPRIPDERTVRVQESEPPPYYLTRDEAEGTSTVAVPIFRDNDDGPEPVFVRPVFVVVESERHDVTPTEYYITKEPASQVAKGIADLQQIDTLLDEAELCLAEAIKAIDYPELHQPEKLRVEIEKAQDCVRRARGLSELAGVVDPGGLP